MGGELVHLVKVQINIRRLLLLLIIRCLGCGYLKLILLRVCVYVCQMCNESSKVNRGPIESHRMP